MRIWREFFIVLSTMFIIISTVRDKLIEDKLTNFQTSLQLLGTLNANFSGAVSQMSYYSTVLDICTRPTLPSWSSCEDLSDFYDNYIERLNTSNKIVGQTKDVENQMYVDLRKYTRAKNSWDNFWWLEFAAIISNFATLVLLVRSRQS